MRIGAGSSQRGATLSLLGTLALFMLICLPQQASAGRSLSVPISTAAISDQIQRIPLFVMKWDESAEPDPLTLRWGRSQVPVRGAGMACIPVAFQFALSRVGPQIRPTGTLSLYVTVSGPMRAEGFEAGVALAIGFLAILKGDRLLQDVAVSGTLLPDGQIGPVTHVAEKARAAAHAGYRLLLVPRGQFYAPRANLVRSSPESKLLVYEVGTIEEAYEFMTGKKL